MRYDLKKLIDWPFDIQGGPILIVLWITKFVSITAAYHFPWKLPLCLFVFLALAGAKELLLRFMCNIPWTCSHYSSKQPSDLPFHLIIYQNFPVWEWKLSYTFSFPLLFNLCTRNGWSFEHRMVLESCFTSEYVSHGKSNETAWSFRC